MRVCGQLAGTSSQWYTLEKTMSGALAKDGEKNYQEGPCQRGIGGSERGQALHTDLAL